MNTFMVVKITPNKQVRGRGYINLCFLPTSKRPSLHLGTHLKEELIGYSSDLKVTRVFPILTQAAQTEDGQHFANDQH